MALVYEKIIEYDKSIECLESALKIDPENQKIKQKLNLIKKQMDKIKEKVTKEL